MKKDEIYFSAVLNISPDKVPVLLLQQSRLFPKAHVLRVEHLPFGGHFGGKHYELSG